MQHPPPSCCFLNSFPDNHSLLYLRTYFYLKMKFMSLQPVETALCVIRDDHWTMTVQCYYCIFHWMCRLLTSLKLRSALADHHVQERVEDSHETSSLINLGIDPVLRGGIVSHVCLTQWHVKPLTPGRGSPGFAVLRVGLAFQVNRTEHTRLGRGARRPQLPWGRRWLG